MIKTFTKNEFTVNVYGTHEDPYFKAREIALLLGYEKPANAISQHVGTEDKATYEKIQGPCKKDLPKIHPQTIFINESGLYSLILGSKLPKAKEFKHWITS